MDKNTQDFFRNIVPFFQFKDIMNLSYYSECPGDWYVLLTDIKGSTQAIKDGRYKEVNMLGASSMAALINIDRRIFLPFVFGGDGATILFPSSIYSKVIEQMQSLQMMAKQFYKLELRVGVVKINELAKYGKKVLVAKYQLSPNNFLAQFQGGGLQLAEEWVKANDPRAQILLPNDLLPNPNLNGLSCRWGPFQSQFGVILSILIKTQNDSTPREIYTKILYTIEEILQRNLDLSRPVYNDGFAMTWPPKSLNLEIRSVKNPILRVIKYFFLLFHSLCGYLLFNFKTNLFFISSKGYRKDSVMNSDCKKFDDTLRLIIDCNIREKDKIEDYLDHLFKQNLIFWGTHASNDALMTCFVDSLPKGKHLHFIDGGDGGYALAAVKMKEQIKQVKIS